MHTLLQRNPWLFVLAGGVLLAGAADHPLTAGQATAKRPVTDEYFGVKVVDDYRWLENFDDPEVRKWSEEQNQRTRAYLDALPSREAITARLKHFYDDAPPRYRDLAWSGGVLFAMKTQPPKQQPFLVTLASVNEPGAERVVVDPNELDSSGATTIDFYRPSLDGKLVAVSLSRNGSEDGALSIFDVSTGKKLPDEVPGVNFPTAGGSVAWNADGTGFYYTRYPRPGERPPADVHFYQQIYFHRLGTPTALDAYATGKEFPRIAETTLDSSEDGKYVLATVANGDGGEFLHYLYGPWGRWKQVTRFSDHASLAAFGPDGALYLVSHDGAPLGKILRLEPPDFSLVRAKVAVAAGRYSVDGFVPAKTKLYVEYMAGGPSHLRVFDLEGKGQRTVEIKPISSVGQMVRMGNDDLLFESQTYLDAPAWYRVDAASGEVSGTALAVKPAATFDDGEVVRQMAVSKDGTKIPLNIIRRKGTKLDGDNPTLLEGYGGFGISQTAVFSIRNRLWLDYGGVVVVANLRGGDEYGEPWHEQGKLTKKQNVFDDFVAAAEYLIKLKYTSPQRLAIEGGSNGGLLMGAALTQRPDLYRAVVSYVGIYDMPRLELFPNGAFNVTEYGTVKDPEQFKALLAYSPYQHVEDGVDYPAVLMLTGDHDGRVDPANSRKMTARLQAATHSGHPILLRTSASTGHGIGTALDERLAQEVDVFSFLFDQLGIKTATQPEGGARRAP